MNARLINPPLNQASVAHVPANNGLWYVLRYRTEPRTVALMLADMANEGYETYLPQFLKFKQAMRNGIRSSKREWVSEPLFGAYMFARRIPGLSSVKHMTRIYGIEGKLDSGVRPMFIDLIRKAEEAIETDKVDHEGKTIVLTGLVRDTDKRYMPKTGYKPPEQWRLDLKAGDVIEFEMIDRFMQAVIEANEKGRLSLLTEFMGQASRFTVDLPVRVRAVLAESKKTA